MFQVGVVDCMAAEKWQKDCGQVTRELGSRVGCLAKEVWVVKAVKQLFWILEGRAIADTEIIDCTNVSTQALLHAKVLKWGVV